MEMPFTEMRKGEIRFGAPSNRLPYQPCRGACEPYNQAFLCVKALKGPHQLGRQYIKLFSAINAAVGIHLLDQPQEGRALR